MTPRFLLALALLTALPACVVDATVPPLPEPGMAPADLVLHSGRIYTVDESRPFVEAVAIRAGRYVRVGTNEAARTLLGPNTRVVDLEGRLALPGLVDCRARPLGGMELEIPLRLPETRDARALLVAVRTYAQTHGDLGWILGVGYDPAVWPTDASPRELLDEAVPDRPVVLTARGGDEIAANSVALGRKGYTDEPSGVLRGSTADEFSAQIPGYPLRVRYEALRTGALALSAVGVTALKTAEGGHAALKTWNLLDRVGELTLLVAVGTEVGNEILARPELYQSPRVFPGFARIGPAEGAALSDQELTDTIARLDLAGVTVTARDVAPVRFLDALERVRRENRRSRRLHVLSLSAFPGPEVAARAARLDVVLEIAPAAPVPGPPPGVLAFGSDWPASASHDPWPAIGAQVAAEPGLTVAQAIRAWTLGAARALRLEAEIGTVDELKRADLIVLDRDVFALEAAGRAGEIGDTRIVMTLFGGRVVYSR